MKHENNPSFASKFKWIIPYICCIYRWITVNILITCL